MSSKKDSRNKRPGFLVDGEAFLFKKIIVENDEPDEQFLLVITPYFGVNRFNIESLISE